MEVDSEPEVEFVAEVDRPAIPELSLVVLSWRTPCSGRARGSPSPRRARVAQETPCRARAPQVGAVPFLTIPYHTKSG